MDDYQASYFKGYGYIYKYSFFPEIQKKLKKTIFFSLIFLFVDKY